MRTVFAIGLLACAPLAAQQPPQATEMPGSPYFIKNTWFIGGVGNWDYLTMDATEERLYVAHGTEVQVVDVESGTLAGRITGLHEAHAVVLDSSGEFGYVSDGPANQVKVFDRRTFQVVASIPTGPMPRALVLDPETGYLFAICTNPLTAAPPPSPAPQPRRPGSAQQPPWVPARRSQPIVNREIKTSISVIDIASRRRVGQILMPGKLGFAQSDGNGQIFVLVENRDLVARLDSSAIAGALHLHSEGASPTPQPESGPNEAAGIRTSTSPATPASSAGEPTFLDWSQPPSSASSGPDAMRLFPLDCEQPSGLAVDGAHQRLFIACGNMRLTVLNAGSGELVTSLPIGPGADTVGYDPARGLIYTANGGAQGTLTVIRQDVTDTYHEVENLPTRRRARTLAINPDTGQVYLVTDYLGVDLSKRGGIGSLKTVPVEGSFQVLVIGH